MKLKKKNQGILVKVMKNMSTERLSILPKFEDLGRVDKSEPILCFVHVKANLALIFLRSDGFLNSHAI